MKWKLGIAIALEGCHWVLSKYFCEIGAIDWVKLTARDLVISVFKLLGLY